LNIVGRINTEVMIQTHQKKPIRLSPVVPTK